MLNHTCCMAQRIDIAESTLSELYYRQGLNQDQIAQQLGISQTTVWRRMSELGLAARPYAVYPDFLRGCVDGDGSIWITHRQGQPLLGIQIASGSRAFVDWLQDSTTRLTQQVSHIYQRERRWDLRFNARYANALAEWVYYAPDVPCLPRKRAEWERYCLMTDH